MRKLSMEFWSFVKFYETLIWTAQAVCKLASRWCHGLTIPLCILYMKFHIFIFFLTDLLKSILHTMKSIRYNNFAYILWRVISSFTFSEQKAPGDTLYDNTMYNVKWWVVRQIYWLTKFAYSLFDSYYCFEEFIEISECHNFHFSV